MRRYVLIQEGDKKDLEKEVNRHLAAGFELTINPDVQERYWAYTQAMILPSPTRTKPL